MTTNHGSDAWKHADDYTDDPEEQAALQEFIDNGRLSVHNAEDLDEFYTQEGVHGAFLYGFRSARHAQSWYEWLAEADRPPRPAGAQPPEARLA